MNEKTKSINNAIQSASKFRILGFNPNSIGKNPKRNKIILELKKKQADIILFSDTRIAKEVEPTVKAEWGGKINFASYTSQARGVAIFFRKEFPIEIIEGSIYNDPSGNFTTLNFKYETFLINLSCIYGPNEDNPLFYKNIVLNEIEKRIEEVDFSILGGDFNLAMSQELDTYGYISENNKNAKIVLKEGLASLGLIDIFRELNPQKKRFSWRQFGGSKRARLDYFFISATSLLFVVKADILPGILSDHSMPSLEIEFSKFQRGRGFFKFNSSLLKDPAYVEVVTDSIRTVASRYAEDVYDPEFLKTATPEQLQELTFTINPQLFLETLLLEIRGNTIQFCARTKKSKNESQKLAIHRLELAEIASDGQPSNTDLKIELENAKRTVEDYAKQNAEGGVWREKNPQHFSASLKSIILYKNTSQN